MITKAPKQKISPETWIKLGIWVGAGVGVAFGVKKVLDYFKPEKKREQTETKQVENELEKEKKNAPASYAASTYSGWASAIAEAIFGYGADFKVIYDITNRLKNNTDFLMLQKAWGSPTRLVFPTWFVFYDTGRQYTLQQAIRAQYSSDQVKKLNSVLQRKGIKYRF
jgi:hypothetical protein